jgi:hypothetical protein
MTTETPDLVQIVTLAKRLPAADQLRLIAQLVPQLVVALPPGDSETDAWEELLRFSDESAHLPRLEQDSADVLSAMRR